MEYYEYYKAAREHRFLDDEAVTYATMRKANISHTDAYISIIKSARNIDTFPDPDERTRAMEPDTTDDYARYRKAAQAAGLSTWWAQYYAGSRKKGMSHADAYETVSPYFPDPDETPPSPDETPPSDPGDTHNPASVGDRPTVIDLYEAFQAGYKLGVAHGSAAAIAASEYRVR